jgi:chromate reductase, NAD(P)H dehydrogenase (quinone)
MDQKKILVLLGSLKNESANSKLVDFFKKETLDFFEVEVFSIQDLPFFNPDLEDDFLPKIVLLFRQKFEVADGILISTPEYVFSLPGVLKNALEWLVSTTLPDKKPTAIITAAATGEVAHESIQLIMNTLGALIIENGSILIKSPKSKIDNSGLIKDEKTLQQMNNLIQNFKEKLQ